jgi:hypothetical protein
MLALTAILKPWAGALQMPAAAEGSSSLDLPKSDFPGVRLCRLLEGLALRQKLLAARELEDFAVGSDYASPSRNLFTILPLTLRLTAGDENVRPYPKTEESTPHRLCLTTRSIQSSQLPFFHRTC